MTREKPPKPYKDFPLYAHANGQWAKKINQKTVFFGPWNDWRRALASFEASRQNPQPNAFDVYCLVNLFLDAQKKRVASDEIKEDTWKEYERVCRRVMEILGRTTPLESLRASHFQALREQLAVDYPNPVTLRNVVVKARVLFQWAYDADCVDQPLRYRDALKRPQARLIRQQKNKAELNLWTRDEVLRLIKKANGAMRPAIYLALNGGIGNRDLCDLPWSAIEGEWLTFPRPKTAVNRRIWLWPETRAELDKWRKKSPKSLWVFCGERGQQLGQESGNTPVPHMFESVAAVAKVATNGRGFYSFRHTYRTIADGCLDQIAIAYTMGHADHSMSGVYREKVGDERLVKVAQFVRAWLVG